MVGSNGQFKKCLMAPVGSRDGRNVSQPVNAWPQNDMDRNVPKLELDRNVPQLGGSFCCGKHTWPALSEDLCAVLVAQVDLNNI